MIPFFKIYLAIKNCHTGESTTLDSFPIRLGGPESLVPLDGVPACLFEKVGNEFIFGSELENQCLLDGAITEVETLYKDRDYSLLIHDHPLMFRITKNPKAWFESLTPNGWRILNKEGGQIAGTSSLDALMQNGADLLAENPGAIVAHSASSCGFYLHSLEFLFKKQKPIPKPTAAPHQSPKPKKQPEATPVINTESGKFTCPACWIKFDRGDVMHIAVHKKLIGDPVLGEEHMLRFLATSFNNLGQALDAMGTATPDMACPHCRRKLPPSFLDFKQHIVSIVGAPSSGKSYFLSVLAHTLQKTLFTNFDIAFYDADPSENAMLTQMKSKLFSAASPREAQLAKTQLEGDMYLRIPRLGRQVRMPRPFVFNITPNQKPDQSFSLVLYDNAGEHFEPNSNSHDSPGAQHVSAASGIVYLFDPTYNLSFRKRLQGHSDPQISDQRFDQQDTILAEMNARVKTLRGVDFKQKIDTPLAVVAGKCDVWMHLLENDSLQDPIQNGKIVEDIVKKNSVIIRQLLHDVVPAIVQNAETISSNVLYFPCSSFGCSPEVVCDQYGNPLLDESGRKSFSPDPNKISPLFVETPMLWLISQFDQATLQLSRS
jgi:hypothetical protein